LKQKQQKRIERVRFKWVTRVTGVTGKKSLRNFVTTDVTQLRKRVTPTVPEKLYNIRCVTIATHKKRQI